MRMRNLLLSITITTSVFVCSEKVVARTAACPCNPCPCAPCACGQSNTKASKPQPTKTTTSKPQTTNKTETRTQSKPREATREHEHDHGHGRGGGASVGVGVNVDLSGVGRRHAEADPFALGGGPQPAAHTQEKPKTPSKPHEAIKTNDFAGVELTGEKAKSEIAPSDPFTDVRLTGEQAKEQN